MPQQHDTPIARSALASVLPQRRHAVATAVLAALLCAAPLARSDTMSPATPPPTSAPASPNERLMRLVPDKVGAWKRHSLRGAQPSKDGSVTPGAQAEFRRGGDRVELRIADGGSAPQPSAPMERNDVEGSERVYSEGGATVRETTRAADGRVDVVLTRADGIVVMVQGTRVPPAELKALALAVRPRS